MPLALAAALALSLVGCADRGEASSTADPGALGVLSDEGHPRGNGDDMYQGAPRATVVDTDHDGTGDTLVAHDDPTPVATDQSDSPEGLEITRLIREAVVADHSLSMGAQNCVIVTNAGVVTLRGDVTRAERDAIETHARSVAGVTRLDDQLNVMN